MAQTSKTSNTDDPRITALDTAHQTFRVESRTRRGLAHAVNVPEGTCTCEAGQHGVECWHLDFCRAMHFYYRYAQRATLWQDRAKRVEKARTKKAATSQPTGMAALQELYPEPAL